MTTFRTNLPRAVRSAALAAALLCGAAGFAPANARTGAYSLALIHVRYSDTTGTAHTLEQLKVAGFEISTFFHQLSYGALDMRVRVIEVQLSRPASYYLTRCKEGAAETRPGCPPDAMAAAAAEAVKARFSFDDVDGIVLLSPFCPLPGYSDVTVGPAVVPGTGTTRALQRSYDYDCPGDGAGYAATESPGTSTVFWGAWAHEIGHQLELIDGLPVFEGAWDGHPGGYRSGYDLMDSCYPCHTNAYSLLDAPAVAGKRKVFPGWLPAAKVRVVETTTPGAMVELAPLETDPLASPLAQAVKVMIAPGKYYLVEARRRLLADAIDVGPGIWDEGVHIQDVEETRDPPALPVPTCGNLFAGPCVSDLTDPALCKPAGVIPRRRGDIPDRCWPFPLWHVGDVFDDRAANVQIRVSAPAGDGAVVTVTRGAPVGRPDLFLNQLSSPAWESADVWVDSSCNGYFGEFFGTGYGVLKYGLDLFEGVANGNGDDPCANHENRIYARIHNGGDAVASNLRVTFRRASPFSVAPLTKGEGEVLGIVTPATTGVLSSLAPGATATVFVPWTPSVPAPADAPPTGMIPFPIRIQVDVDAAGGESVVSNNMAIEDFAQFEIPKSAGTRATASRDLTVRYAPSATDPRPPKPKTFYIDFARGDLPADWRVAGADPKPFTLNAGAGATLPVVVQVPANAQSGQTYHARMVALADATLNGPAGRPHVHRREVAALALAPRVVLPSALDIELRSAARGPVSVTGRLEPPVGGAIVALDYVDRSGARTTRLAAADRRGVFVDTFCPGTAGKWRVQALWQGDMRTSSAASVARSASVDCRR